MSKQDPYNIISGAGRVRVPKRDQLPFSPSVITQEITLSSCQSDHDLNLLVWVTMAIHSYDILYVTKQKIRGEKGSNQTSYL